MGFERNWNQLKFQLKVLLHFNSKYDWKSIQSKLKPIESQTSNQLKVSWNQLKVNWNQLKVNWTHFKINWNQFKVTCKSIENTVEINWK